MATSPASTATAPHVGAGPLPGSTGERLPDAVQDVRIGRGTVRSEVDRTIRFRLEGEGPPSSRSLLPDSRAAAELAAQAGGGGAKLQRALSSILSVADAWVGHENLKTITLAPDEHAIKATQVLNTVLRAPDGRYADITPAGARQLVREVTAGVPARVGRASAWNGAGHITITPDASRDILATLGLYRIQPGDSLADRPVSGRADRAVRRWNTGIHETYHSVTPRPEGQPAEWARVFEESISTVLPPMVVRSVISAGGGDPALAARPVRDTRHEVVDWPAWNRDHLPQRSQQDADEARRRYLDGPKLLRELVSLAGIDRRTRAGREATIELLQAEDATKVPGRLARAIAARHELAAPVVGPLERLIRRSAVGEVPPSEITRFVEAAAPPPVPPGP